MVTHHPPEGSYHELREQIFGLLRSGRMTSASLVGISDRLILITACDSQVLRGATCALLEKHPATLQKSLIHLAMAWCDGLAALRD